MGIFKSIWFWLVVVALLLVAIAVLSIVYLSWLEGFWNWLREGTVTQAVAEEEIITKESNSTTIRNIGLVVGGMIAIGLAVWRSRVAERQADAAQQQAIMSQQQADLAQRGLLNERYQRGVEMLGSAVLSVRIGGIYALRSLAEDYPEQYHIEAMRSLCAFVRNPTKYEPQPPGGEPEPREDVQVALDAICACHEINTSLDNVTEFW